jgi:hypothetical protein
MKSRKIIGLFITLVILFSMIGGFSGVIPTTQQGKAADQATSSSDQNQQLHMGKFAGGDPDQQQSSVTSPGEGPVGGYEAYLAAERTYPADQIPPAVAAQASVT